MISKSCKYAIRAAIFIASKANEDIKFSSREIAKEIEAPPVFTGKVLQILHKHRIINCIKGPHGGFYCEKPQLSVPVIDIVNAIDGLSVFKECVLGLHECSAEHPCPMHHTYQTTRDQVKECFQTTTVGSLAKTLNKGQVYINNLD